MKQNRWKREGSRTTVLALAAVALALMAQLPMAWGYFSTYTEAKGRVVLQPWKVETEINEKVSDWTKHVVVTNSADGSPVYVRAKAFAGEGLDITYETGGNWTLGEDGYYYYNGILEPKAETPELLVKINNPPKEGEDGQQFNVVVIYESTPVRYNEAGDAFADWQKELHVRERSGE